MTGTQTDGTVVGYKCVDWTSSDAGGATGNVLVGLHSAADSQWTVLGNSACSVQRPIYCFGDESATFNVDLAETVTCTFTNALPGECTVNTDGDALFDCVDADDDNDGVPDLSDPQPLNPNLCGVDSDGDSCDDCTFGVDGLGPLADAFPAFDGTDTDGDGACDALDCAVGDPGNSMVLIPVRSLVFTSTTAFQWTAPLHNGGGALIYDVLRSDTPSDFGGAACHETNITGVSSLDATLPSAGAVSYYLIRVEAACGGEHLGLTSAGPDRRTGASCP